MDPTPVPKPSDDEVARLLAEHGPSRPQAYLALRPWRDLIAALRSKGASAETIRHVLRARDVHVSETTVRNFLRDVLGEAPATMPTPPRRRRKPRVQEDPIPPSTESLPAAIPPSRARGPRIANLKRNPDL